MNNTKIIIIIIVIALLLVGGIMAYFFLIQPQNMPLKEDSNALVNEQENGVAAQDKSLKNSIFLDSKSQEDASESKSIQTNTVSPNLEVKPYISSKGKFQINAPKGWKVDESGQLGMTVIFKNTKTEIVGSTPFNANITVATKPTSGRDIRQCAETIKKGMPILLQGYQLVEDRSTVVSGHPAIIIGGKYTAKSQVSTDLVNIRNLQLLVEDGRGTLFTGTATALESTWNDYKDILESSLLTLKID